jgi:hypothetical protein
MLFTEPTIGLEGMAILAIVAFTIGAAIGSAVMAAIQERKSNRARG